MVVFFMRIHSSPANMRIRGTTLFVLEDKFLFVKSLFLLVEWNVLCTNNGKK